MPRLAWFAPVPPSRSGIAAYNAELLPLLSASFEIDVFTAPAPGPFPRPAAHPPVYSAHDFPWKHFTASYDLIVYQLGNAPCHDFMWPYLFRYPGLVVLHDVQLHHSRARWLLARGRGDDYCAEFHANHEGADPDLPRLIMEDLADASYYFWPMSRLVATTARLVAVHSARLASSLAAEYGIDVSAIRMGVLDPRSNAATAGVDDPIAEGHRRCAALRARLGLTPQHILFAAFGLVTPEKRLSQVVGVLGDVARAAPKAHVVLVGASTDHCDLMAEARQFGVEGRITMTGYVPDEELAVYLAAADVCLCLRWPTGRETSASWIRALAAGRPTIVTDLSHTDEMASLDPRTWAVQAACSGEAAGDAMPNAVCVSIDVLDENHSLRLAMSRLAIDASLRERLGRAARAHWESQHTLSCMEQDYRAAIARALARPVPVSRLATLPAHLRADGTEQARAMLETLGVHVDFLTGSGPAFQQNARPGTS